MSRTERNWQALIARNLTLPGTEPNVAGALQRKADSRLQARKPQKPCDIGLFSDDAAQLDLCEMFQQPTNEE